MIHPERLKQLKHYTPYLFRPGSILNVGANRIRFDLLPELHNAGREITLLEAWPENVKHWANEPRLKETIEGDVREIDKLKVGTFDVVLWWHGPEHIERDELEATIAKLEAAAEGLVVLGCPWGVYKQGPFMGNPYDEHKASLYPADFEAMGYQVATIGEADKHGSLMAWKWLRNQKKAGPQIPHVVMVTHGEREEYLKQTIPAVLRTTWPLTLTVIANAPGDKAAKYLRSMRPELFKLQIYKRNQGKPRAANRGWIARDADYTVLLDDDALPLEPDWLRKLVDIADKIPQAGIIGHSMEATNWPTRVLGEPARTVQVQPGNLGGACMLVPRRTVEACGYYNEELPHYGESDGLYGWKVRKSGRLCVYFDHSDLGRSFAHLGEATADDDPEYAEWKKETRREAQEIMQRLMAEYEAGRPLNQ